MLRSWIVFLAVIAHSACGGASKLSEAPRAAPPQACFATRDAAKAAGAVVYATNGNYPKTFFAMTKGSSPVLVANDDPSFFQFVERRALAREPTQRAQSSRRRN